MYVGILTFSVNCPNGYNDTTVIVDQSVGLLGCHYNGSQLYTILIVFFRFQKLVPRIAVPEPVPGTRTMEPSTIWNRQEPEPLKLQNREEPVLVPMKIVKLFPLRSRSSFFVLAFYNFLLIFFVIIHLGTTKFLRKISWLYCALKKSNFRLWR